MKAIAGKPSCQNRKCREYQQTEHGNIWRNGWNDKSKTIRSFKCRVCGQAFSARKGSIYYGSRLKAAEDDDLAEVIRILLFEEDLGIRKAAEKLGLNKDTVARYRRLLIASGASGPPNKYPLG